MTHACARSTDLLIRGHTAGHFGLRTNATCLAVAMNSSLPDDLFGSAAPAVDDDPDGGLPLVSRSGADGEGTEDAFTINTPRSFSEVPR